MSGTTMMPGPGGDGGAANSSGPMLPPGFVLTPDLIYASGMAPILCLTNSARACSNFPSFRLYLAGFGAFAVVLAVFGLFLVVARIVIRNLRDRFTSRTFGNANHDPDAALLDVAIMFGVLQAVCQFTSFVSLFNEWGAMVFMTISGIAYLLGYSGLAIYLHHLLKPIALWSPRVRLLVRLLPGTMIMPVAQVPVRIYNGIFTDASLTSPPTDAANARLAAFGIAVSALYTAAIGNFFAIALFSRTGMGKTLKLTLGPDGAAAALKGPVNAVDHAATVSKLRKFDQDPRQRLYEQPQPQSQRFGEGPQYRQQQLEYQSPPYRSPFESPPPRRSSSYESQYTSPTATYYSPTPSPGRESRFGDDSSRRSRRLVSKPQVAVSTERMHIDSQARTGAVAATARVLEYMIVVGGAVMFVNTVASILSEIYSARLDIVFVTQAVAIWGVIFTFQVSLFVAFMFVTRMVVHDFWDVFPARSQRLP
ncbi:hypothetical protein DFJ73DRAFT_901288 [Zopfochytrium polystomum]|nr:hypothetical protein DFJ73DRAFT_901288 [Zopfochytrium polystomum]